MTKVHVPLHDLGFAPCIVPLPWVMRSSTWPGSVTATLATIVPGPGVVPTLAMIP